MVPNRSRDGWFWGVPLIIVGFLFLLQNFNLIGSLRDLFLALMFGAGGVLFLMVFQREPRTQWWALIPSFALIGLSAREFVEWGLPAVGRYIGDSIFLSALGAAFLLIYLFRRDHWWPIIPAGALLVLAVEEFLEFFLPARMTEGLFLAGLGLTFFIIYYLHRTNEQLRWTLVVSLALLALSAGKVIQAVIVWKYAWPLGLVALGIFLIVRQMPKRQ